MDKTCQGLIAGAGLAVDEHREVVGRHPLGQVEGGLPRFFTRTCTVRAKTQIPRVSAAELIAAAQRQLLCTIGDN